MLFNELPSHVKKTLHSLKISNAEYIGKGGEGYIFGYKNDLIIKIYDQANKENLVSLEVIQKCIADHNLPFDTPKIEEIGDIEGQFYTIEKRLKEKI